jgi:transcription termination factor NusB
MHDNEIDEILELIKDFSDEEIEAFNDRVLQLFLSQFA